MTTKYVQDGNVIDYANGSGSKISVNSIARV